MPKNYYLILGLAHTASVDDIRGAFRALAKRYHPDCCGGSEHQFMEIHEAYAVLSDPERRRGYDDELDRENIFHPHAPRRRSGAAPGPGPGSAEPLTEPGRRAPRRRHEPMRGPEPLSPASIADFSAINSFAYDWLDRWDLLDLIPAGAAREWTVDVTLTETEAARGGEFPVRLPLWRVCPVCHGRGGVMFYTCSHCSGAGRVETELPLAISFPPNIPDNYVWRLALDRHGLPGGRLTLQFRVTIDE